MEHGGDVNPNLETEPSENFCVADFQDDGGVDSNSVAGPSGTVEYKEISLIELEINQSIETTKVKNNNDNAKTLEVGNNGIVETKIQDKESGKNHYICKFCSQVFYKHQALGGHMNGHSKDQRNLRKFEKVKSWIHETYPPPLKTTLVSEVKKQGTPTNGATCNSYNHPIEDGDVYSQLGKQWTNQQSTQQIQLSQCYQYSQGLQSGQALQNLQNYQAPQRLQNYQTPQRLQNHQASQGSQRYQTSQQFQSHQTPQELEYYQALEGSQNCQVPRGIQYYQAPQRFQNYQTPQGPQSYQTPQEFQNHQALQGSQNYQALQGTQGYEVPQGSQSYQIPHGQWQQVVVDANNQQQTKLTSKTSNNQMSPAKIPSNEPKNNFSNSQGLHFQKEAQGPPRYMSYLHDLCNDDYLTTRPFINEQSNEEYYTQFKPNVVRRNNQMITIPQNHNVVAQSRPTNSPSTSNSFNQSKGE